MGIISLTMQRQNNARIREVSVAGVMIGLLASQILSDGPRDGALTTAAAGSFLGDRIDA